MAPPMIRCTTCARWISPLADGCRDCADTHARIEAETVAAIVAWLRRYADECSGSHPANAGHIACNAAANLIERGDWKGKT